MQSLQIGDFYNTLLSKIKNIGDDFIDTTRKYKIPLVIGAGFILACIITILILMKKRKTPSNGTKPGNLTNIDIFFDVSV
jgi:hypothetical protein